MITITMAIIWDRLNKVPFTSGKYSKAALRDKHIGYPKYSEKA